MLVTVPARTGTKTLLSTLSFDVGEGEFVAIIGASGCGKSTLIKALAGLLEPEGGQIIFAGQPIQVLRDRLPLAVSYLPQFGSFHSLLTVKENLETAASLRLPPQVADERRRRWMIHVSQLARIDPLFDQYYRTLSGGQMRRMALAEELIGDPAFLLLDELTSGLDAFSDQEMMAWLRDLAHRMLKTVILVTHNTNYLENCDRILFLHQGRLIHYGSYRSLLEGQGADSVAALFALYQAAGVEGTPLRTDSEPAGEAVAALTEVRSLPPPGGLRQFPTLLRRQARLFVRDRSQMVLHLVLIATFPLLVAVFATGGLPQVRNQTLALETNILRTLQEQLLYVKESFQSASLISGLAMFQVILLTLIGANNGAREIAKERAILAKELRAGLSPVAYVAVKFVQIVILCAIQALWMAAVVKWVCGFPGLLVDQAAILFLTTLAMSVTCLAISAASPSPERASLLAIYLVGFQLPLSGAALALPDWLSSVCRPFIAAYWGWSGYLQTFRETRYFDIVRQGTETWIAPFPLAASVLGTHVGLALVTAVILCARSKRSADA